jgi:hypothetical protein
MDPIAASPQVGDALRSSVDLVISFGTDFFAFIVVAALVAAFAFYFGRDRLVPLMAGLYAGIPLYLNFPYMALLGSNAYLHIGLYAAFVLVGLVGFMGLSSWVPSSGVGYIKTLGLSALAAGLVLAVSINILPLHEIYMVSEPTRALFSSSYFFWWLIAGLGGVLFLSK